jgi:uncharacterized membrane protein
MNAAHLSNLLVHVIGASAAIGLGFILLAGDKGTAPHRQRGLMFVALVLLVCASAAVGSVFFRFIPIFAILTVLVLYQLLSGWHAVKTRERGPNRIDLALAGAAGLGAAMLAPVVLATQAQSGQSPVVIYATLATLALLLSYDLARWAFPHRWHSRLWKYEHIYKMVATVFALLSAASGNLLAFAQPWSQILPSALGLATIAALWWRQRAT